MYTQHIYIYISYIYSIYISYIYIFNIQLFYILYIFQLWLRHVNMTITAIYGNRLAVLWSDGT